MHFSVTLCRLLDVCYGNVTGHAEINLTLVFEYVEQDLATYLERCPSPGLGPDRIRVSAQQSIVGRAWGAWWYC